MKSGFGGCGWCGGNKPTGAVRPVKGVLPIALGARGRGMVGMLVPPENAPEAAVVSGLRVIPIQNLREAASFLEGETKIAPTKVDIAGIFRQTNEDEIDFAEVKGQESVKRALEIAAAGGHNVLLIGPPGTVKSMLVAAMNPSPDGKMPSESRCSPREIQNYLGRISGPLLDRIDLHIEVPPVKFREISSERTGEPSAQIRERVVAARNRQQERFKYKPKITCNARMGSRELKSYCA